MRSSTRGAVWLDGALAALGLVFGSASLAYPLALDSAVNYYVAREWLLRGALPYRDVFDHRAPGIYLLHAACIALFGEGAWGIHVAELAAIVAIGWLAAVVVSPRFERPLPGMRGMGILASAVFYYGFFDYWCTAQCELWSALAVVVALAAVRRVRDDQRSAIVSGLSCGVALLLKPPVAPMLLVVAAMMFTRARSRARERLEVARSLGLFAGSAALPLLGVLLYFAACGGLPALVDVFVGANTYYVSHEPPDFGVALVVHQLALAWRFFAPFDTLIVGACAAGAALAWPGGRRDRGTYLAIMGLLAAVIVAVVVQRKFYLYHWSLGVAPVALLAAIVSRSLLAHVAGRRRWARASVAAGMVLAFYSHTGGPFDVWWRTTAATAAWAAGRADRAQLAASYSTLEHFYSYRVVYSHRERVGLWLREHCSPDDKILVRGMAAEIYLLSGRRAPGRFFWSLFLTLPSRAYHRDAWLREDREAIERDPPRYVVAYAGVHAGVDSPEWFTARGYVPRAHIEEFVILERDPTAATAQPRPALQSEARRL